MLTNWLDGVCGKRGEVGARYLLALSLSLSLLGFSGCSSDEPAKESGGGSASGDEDDDTGGDDSAGDDGASDDDTAADDDSAGDDDGPSGDDGKKPVTPLDSGSKDAGAGSGGKDTGTSGRSDASTSSSSGSDASPPPVSTGGPLGDDCTSLPATTDYAAKGPFADAKMFDKTGPTGGYFMYRPDASLGKDGFKHPVIVWGNGIATTADQYKELLTQIATHGWVVIACPDTMAERDCLNKGMEWLVQQNTAEGPLKGKLDVSREATIGYSWGGGASIDTANRPNVKATVSIHGMPPRLGSAFNDMHAPLLLFTSTGDTFVSASGYVTPNYNKSTKVPTFYATLQENVGHLYPLDKDAVSCVAEIALGGPCSGSIAEQAPTVAFLRHFVCGDQGAKKYFFGSDCELCNKGKWKSQNKPADAWK